MKKLFRTVQIGMLCFLTPVGISAQKPESRADVTLLEHPSTFPLLFAELMRRGYSDQDLRKIASQNLLRAMRVMEQTARRLQKERSPSLSDMRGRMTP